MFTIATIAIHFRTCISVRCETNNQVIVSSVTKPSTVEEEKRKKKKKKLVYILDVKILQESSQYLRGCVENCKTIKCFPDTLERRDKHKCVTARGLGNTDLDHSPSIETLNFVDSIRSQALDDPAGLEKERESASEPRSNKDGRATPSSEGE